MGIIRLDSRQRAFFWVSTGLAALALVLVVVNAILWAGNRRVQVEVTQRQQYINQTIQMARVQEYIVRQLAAVAVQGDDQARTLLQDLGVTITATPAPAVPTGPALPSVEPRR